MEECWEHRFLKASLPPVQMAPPTLNVTKSRDGYTLSWTEGEMLYKHIGHTFQIQYKKDVDTWEVRAYAREGGRGSGGKIGKRVPTCRHLAPSR